MKNRILFKHNGSIIWETFADLYTDEIEGVKKFLAITNNILIEDISIETVPIDNISNMCVTEDGKLAFIGLEFYNVVGLRLDFDYVNDELFEQFLNKIVDKKADENLVFTI